MKRLLMPDLIRVTAMILVLVGHLSRPLITLFPLYQITIQGFGVSLFFILSGVVLELKYRNKKINIQNFYKKRFIRIYPTYFLALLFSLLIYFIIIPAGEFFLSPDFTVVNFLCSLTFSCIFFGRWNEPFLPAAWFLGVIFVFYLIYPILSKILNKYSHSTIIILLFLSLFTKYIIINLVDVPHIYTTIDRFSLSRLFEFGFGVYLVNIIKPSFWETLKTNDKISAVISFLVDISLPFFLIHGALIFSIDKFRGLGISLFFSIIAYTFLSLLISWLIFIITRSLFKKSAL